MSKFKELATSVSRNYSLKLLQVKKNSPAIMFGTGLVLGVTTVVLASRATLKLEDHVEGIQKNLDQATQVRDAHIEGYTEDDYKRDSALIYVKGALNIAKLYAPAIVVGGLAVACLTGAHVTLTRRNGAIMAAYVALDKGFKEFEARVKNEVGEEKLKELKHGYEEREVFEEGKKGEPIVKNVRSFGHPSVYAKIFGPNSPAYENSPEHNLFFLKSQQSYFNEQLQVKGYVMLNDVYDALGLERTTPGAVVGWVYGEDLPGDNYIDFGCWAEGQMERFHEFMVGREKELLLDFNVAGPVYELIDRLEHGTDNA